MEHFQIWLLVAFFFTAFFYSMVGFGGGSAYLAILVLAGLPYTSIPPIALLSNIIVAGTGFWHFSREGHFEYRKVLPFVILSIPMAYLGGKIELSKTIFSMILGVALLVAALRIFLPDQSFEGKKEIPKKTVWIVGLPMGGLLGFISGLIGIGGGIFLSPLLLLMKWVDVRGAAAAASFFIVVNSVSGLAGHLERGTVSIHEVIPLALSVFAGGFIGSRLASKYFPSIILRGVLAGLIFFVSFKLIGGAL